MFSGDTVIYTLLDVATPTTLKKLYEANIYPIPVFTMLPEKVSVGWIERIVSLGEFSVNTVTLDDGSSIKVNKTQNFIMRDNSRLLLSGLSEGKSLMPLYLSKDSCGYVIYGENTDYFKKAPAPIDKRYSRKVSRMVAEFKINDRLIQNTHISYKDENRNNCHPDNIEVTYRGDKLRKRTGSLVKALIEARDFINSVNNKNHKVKSITEGGKEVMFGIKASCDNIALSGIFVGTDDCE